MSQAPRVNRDDQESLDGYLASWHATMKLLRVGRSFSGRERNCVFLNRNGDGFNDVSSILGVDFADDGRAIAMTDWDHDGDLDIWFHNRTGPRLRLMQNNTVTGGNANRETRSLSLRLRGVRCNRDAIGARVKLELAGESKPILRTLYAGDAYLSQSSKWMHFGLGNDAEIRSLEIRWPSGETEMISGLTPGGRFMIQQGMGKGERVDDLASTRNIQLHPAKQESPALPGWERVAFVSPLPLPRLEATNDRGESLSLLNKRRQLIVFWASWCENCLDELKRLESSHQELADAGITVTLVNVDNVSTTESTLKRPRLAAEKRYRSTQANQVLIDKLHLVQRIVLTHELPFAVPLTLLVDEDGGLAALYRGNTPCSAIISDAQWLGRSLSERRLAAVPFAGTWTTAPPRLLMRPVATLFREQGYDQDAVDYLKHDFDVIDARRNATDGTIRQMDLQFAQSSFNLGRSHQVQGQLQQAIDYYRQGLSVLPESAQAHYHLANALAETNKPDEAIASLRIALDLNEELHEARLKLSQLLRRQGNRQEAELQLQQLLAHRRDDADALFTMGMLKAEQGNQAAALDFFLRVISVDPTRVDSWTNAGSLLAKMGRIEQAKAALSRAIELDDSNLQARISLGGLFGATQNLEQAILQFREALAIDPQNNAARQGLAQAFLASGDFIEAGKQFESAIRFNSRDFNSFARLAWLRATAPDASARNGAQAVQLAARLAEATRNSNAQILDILAAAQAENGQFELAVETVQKAINLTAGTPESTALQERLELYQNQKAYREDHRSQQSNP